MTELTDASGVTWRTGHERVENTVPWRRRVGGDFGGVVELPAGAYSDDTQLRLATSRAIRADGTFDVEAFSKIELPVFQNYALGAGRGTRAASEALVRTGVTWCTNFFEGKRGNDYISGGGNGAAMRIQPHVWSACGRSVEGWLADVIRNAITSHGHARGLAGAVLHAALLDEALGSAAPPDPKRWADTLDILLVVSEVVLGDEELSTLWLPSWEQRTGTTLPAAMASVLDECRVLVSRLADLTDAEDWHSVVEPVGGFDPTTRGSGTVTALLAAALAWRGRHDPAAALVEAVNTLGSDTDTIATMAGALLGPSISDPPPGPVQDEEFLRIEAYRLSAMCDGKARTTFRYPDLLGWSLPKATVDYVGRVNGEIAIAGLGALRPTSDLQPSRGKSDSAWQWAMLPFGQSLLIRRRAEPRPLDDRLIAGTGRPVSGSASQTGLFDTPAERSKAVPQTGRKRSNSKTLKTALVQAAQADEIPTHEFDLDSAVDLAVGSGFPPELVGRLVLGFARGHRPREHVAAFSAALVEAILRRPGTDS